MLTLSASWISATFMRASLPCVSLWQSIGCFTTYICVSFVYIDSVARLQVHLYYMYAQKGCLTCTVLPFQYIVATDRHAKVKVLQCCSLAKYTLIYLNPDRQPCVRPVLHVKLACLEAIACCCKLCLPKVHSTVGQMHTRLACLC